jgi:hypothetical protein
MQEVMQRKRLFYAVIVTSILAFCGTILSPGSVFASINREVNYQAALKDSTGKPVGNGSYNFRFKLYASSTGGSPVWTEAWCKGSSCDGSGTDNRVSLTNGYMSTQLGALTALTSVDFNQPLWLSVEVGSTTASATWDGEMSPRKKLGAAPQAFNSEKLDGQAASYYLDANNLTNLLSRFATFLAATTTDALTEGTSSLYFTNTRARSAISSSALGLTYSTSTGALSLTSGYTIPLSASTTDWQSFFVSPSSRITAGQNLSWSSSTLGLSGVIGVSNGGTGASSTPADGQLVYGSGGVYAFISTSTIFASTTSNRVGIGTTNPTSTFEVVGTTTLRGVLPSSDNTYDIGSPSARFRSLYLASSSIHLESLVLSNVGGSLYVNGSPVSPTSTDGLPEGVSNLYFTNARSRSAISSSATGLSYATSTGALSLTSGYNIPLSASTTAWQNFFTTPSSQITAGIGLSWTGSTLGGAFASQTIDGLVSTSTQAFGGDKTFMGSVSISGTTTLATTSVTGFSATGLVSLATTTVSGFAASGSTTLASTTAASLTVNGATTLATTTIARMTVAGISTLSGSLTLSALTGGLLQADSSGVVSTTSIGSLTSNSLASVANVLTSIVNGITSTTTAVNSVSNTSSANTLSTTVNGVTGSTVNIINSNGLSWSGQTLTSMINGVSTTTTISYANATTDGLVSSSTQSFGGNKTFNGALSLGSTLGVAGVGTLATTTVTQLTASGQVSLATTSATQLTVSGATALATTTITGLTTTGATTLATTTLTNFTSGSVLFIDSSSAITQNSSKLYWDSAQSRFAIGTGTPLATIDIYGDAILEGSSRYVNFGSTVGTSGYGFHDNSGILQFKNSGGGWTNIATSTDNLVEGLSNLYYTDTRSRAAISNSVTGLAYSTSTGAFSIETAYNIPLGASTTNWQSFFSAPSTQISAGTGLSWAGNTLSAPNAFLNGGNSFGALASLGTSDGNALRFLASSSEYMRITTAGRVGIGTTTPLTQLHIKADASSEGRIALEDTSGALSYLGNFSAAFDLWNGQNTYMRFGTNDSEKMRLSAAGGLSLGSSFAATDPGAGSMILSGSLGIGTSSVGVRKLVISGSSAANEGVYVRNTSTGGASIELHSNGSSGRDWSVVAGGSANGSNSGNFFVYDNTGSTARLVISSSTGALTISQLTSCGLGVSTNANGTLTCTSDGQLKDIHEDYTRGLSAIMGIDPKVYSWKSDSYLADGGALNYGFIAQNIQGVMPEAVGTGSLGYLQVNNLAIQAALVNATKDIAKFIFGTTSSTTLSHDLNIMSEGLIPVLISTSTATTTPTGEVSFFGRLAERIVAWLGSAVNGIGDLFAHRAIVDELCVKDSSGEMTCLTKAQVDGLLDDSNSPTQVTPPPSAPSDPGPSTSEEGGGSAETGTTTEEVSSSTEEAIEPTATSTE